MGVELQLWCVGGRGRAGKEREREREREREIYSLQIISSRTNHIESTCKTGYFFISAFWFV